MPSVERILVNYYSISNYEDDYENDRIIEYDSDGNEYNVLENYRFICGDEDFYIASKDYVWNAIERKFVSINDKNSAALLSEKEEYRA